MVGLIPLKTLDIARHMEKINSLKGKAKAYSKIGAPKVPGVPDIPSMVQAMLEAEAKKYLEQARTEIIALLVLIMANGIVQMIPTINKIIRVFNGIITAIGAVLVALAAAAAFTFTIIIIITIVYVVAKIVSLIPAVTVGLGAGVAFTMHISISTEIMKFCDLKLKELHPVAAAIVAVMMMLLSVYGLFQLIVSLINSLASQQDSLKSEADDALNTSADDFAISSEGDTDGDGVVFVECTLPDGTKAQMTPEECLAAGGSFPPEEDMLRDLNDLDNRINELNGMLGACLLPDGTVKQMTPEDCAAAGGIFGGAVNPNLCWDNCGHGLDLDGSKKITCQLPNGSSKDMTLGECNAANGIDLSVANLMGLLSDLKNQRDELCEQLGPLCDFQLNDNLITSLLYGHDDVTIEKATEKSGKRKGFYSEDI